MNRNRSEESRVEYSQETAALVAETHIYRNYGVLYTTEAGKEVGHMCEYDGLIQAFPQDTEVTIDLFNGEPRIILGGQIVDAEPVQFIAGSAENIGGYFPLDLVRRESN